MKAKHLSLGIAALLVAGGLWLAWTARRTHASQKSSGPDKSNSDANSAASSSDAAQSGPNDRVKPGQMLRPPDPSRRFTDFTPEQRVEFARKGHGPGG